MPQIVSHPAMNFDKVSPTGHRPTSLSLPPNHGKLKTLQWSSVKGIGAIRIEELLPQAQDRLVTVGTGAPLTEAAQFLFEPTCRMVVVCDHAGIMMGVITRTDIIRQIRHCQGCSCTTRCLMIMTTQVISCRPDDRLDEIWTVMKENGLHSVPVIDRGGRPLGLLSARDGLEALLASVECEKSLLSDFVMGVGYR